MGVPLEKAPVRIGAMLKEMQVALFQKALAFREANTFAVNTYDEFKKQVVI